MLDDHRGGLLSYSLFLDSSVGLSAGIQSAGGSVSETLGSNPAADEDNLSPYDSYIACQCQSIEVNNKHGVYG